VVRLPPRRLSHLARLLLRETLSGPWLRMIDEEDFQRLLPMAWEWANAQEEFILERGASLGPIYSSDAERVGIKEPSRVRVLIVDRIPVPEDEQLAEAAARSLIITSACRGVAIGHGIIIRLDCWGDRELMVHQLIHVAQCERAGGLESFVYQYLCQRQTCPTFTVGSFENEARGMARQICAAPMAKF
jgi:hypothetical protein